MQRAPVGRPVSRGSRGTQFIPRILKSAGTQAPGCAGASSIPSWQPCPRPTHPAHPFTCTLQNNSASPIRGLTCAEHTGGGHRVAQHTQQLWPRFSLPKRRSYLDPCIAALVINVGQPRLSMLALCMQHRSSRHLQRCRQQLRHDPACGRLLVHQVSTPAATG